LRIRGKNMDTSQVYSSGVLNKGEEIIEFVESLWKKDSNNVVNGNLLITNRRLLFLKKQGLFAKGLNVIFTCSLGDILSVSHGGLFGKRLQVSTQLGNEVKTQLFSCKNPEVVNQKINGAKNEFIEEQKIIAKSVIIQEGTKDKAMEILQKRLARGEITLEEFHQLVQRL
jgi:hypothetical protein